VTARGFLGGGFLSGFGSFSEVATNVATLPDISTPSAPTDGVKLFSSDIAGRSMLSTIDSGGIPNPLQASWAHKRIGSWTSNINAGGLVSNGAIGTATVGGSGNVTARQPAATNLATSMVRIAVVSGAGAGNAAVLRGTNAFALLRGDAARVGGFYASFRFTISDAVIVATANMFVGLVNASLSADVAPSSLTNLIGVGCDNGDTTLQLYAAGSSAQSRVNLGASFPVDTVTTDVYELVLYAPPNGSNVKYRVTRLNTGDTTSGTISAAANLPASTTFLQPHYIRSNGGTASAVAFDMALTYVESEF